MFYQRSCVFVQIARGKERDRAPPKPARTPHSDDVSVLCRLVSNELKLLISEI